MTVSIIQINDSWPNALIWRSNRGLNPSADEEKLLSLKAQVNAHHVDEFQDLLQMLANNTYSLVGVHINNIVSSRSDRIEILTGSIRTICSCAKRPIPTIIVYAFGFSDKTIIQQLLDSDVDIIDLNVNRRVEQDWKNVQDHIENNKRYVDPITVKYMTLTVGSKKLTKLARRIESGTVGYYLCPRISATDEVAANVKLLKKDLNLDACAVENFTDIFPLLGDPLRQVDIIWVDAEEIADHGKVTPYQLVNTITTIIETTGRRYRTKLCIAVDSSTPIQLMRELQKLPGVYSLFGRSPEFPYSKIRDQIKLILADRDPTPDSIKQLISGKTLKPKTGIHLTDREIQIRDLVCKNGAGNKAIANSLGISEATIKVHMGTVFRKYGVKSRSELLLKVNNLG